MSRRNRRKYDGAEQLRIANEVRHLNPDIEDDFLRLLKFSRHKDGYIRSEALDVLYGTTNQMALQRYRECLEDRSPVVRMSALEGIGEHGNEDDICGVTKLLKDKDEFVRCFAVYTLSDIGGYNQISVIRDFIKCAKTELERVYAYFALINLGDLVPISTFLDFLHSDLLSVVEYIMNNIERIVDDENIDQVRNTVVKIDKKWKLIRGLDVFLKQFDEKVGSTIKK